MFVCASIIGLLLLGLLDLFVKRRCYHRYVAPYGKLRMPGSAELPSCGFYEGRNSLLSSSCSSFLPLFSQTENPALVHSETVDQVSACRLLSAAQRFQRLGPPARFFGQSIWVSEWVLRCLAHWVGVLLTPSGGTVTNMRCVAVIWSSWVTSSVTGWWVEIKQSIAGSSFLCLALRSIFSIYADLCGVFLWGFAGRAAGRRPNPRSSCAALWELQQRKISLLCQQPLRKRKKLQFLWKQFF